MDMFTPGNIIEQSEGLPLATSAGKHLSDFKSQLHNRITLQKMMLYVNWKSASYSTAPDGDIFENGYYHGDTDD